MLLLFALAQSALAQGPDGVFDVAGVTGLPEEPLQSFTPATPRSEADADAVDATALITQARVLQQREEWAPALARYQRAFRYLRDGAPVLQEIVGLSFLLGRNLTAARYAVIQAERDPRDADLLTHLADYLAQRGDSARAAALYDHVVRLREKQDATDEAATLARAQYERGRLHYLSQNFVAASDAFSFVADAVAHRDKFGLSKDDMTRLMGAGHLTYTIMGEAHFQAGRYGRALRAFEKAYQLKPDAAFIAYQRARVAWKQNRLDEAERRIEEYLAAKADMAGEEAYELLANVYEQTRGEKAEAALIERLRKASDAAPKNTSLANFLMRRYLAAGDLSTAEAMAERSLAAGLTAVALIGKIDIYARAGDVQRLLTAMGTAIDAIGLDDPLSDALKRLAEDKRLTQGLFALADKIVTPARTPGPAAENFARLPPLDEESRSRVLAAAHLALTANDGERAHRLFRLALAGEQGETAVAGRLSAGLSMLVHDDYAPAAALLKQALDALPPAKHGPEALENEAQELTHQRARIYFYLAGALELAGDTAAALANAENAILLDATLDIEEREAWILYHARRYDDARAVYETLLNKYGDRWGDSDVREGVKSLRLAVAAVCVELKDFSAAEEYLEQVLDEFPEDVGAMNDLGYLWADQNQHLQRALAMTRQAVAAEPDNPAYRDSLGWVYYRLGRFEEAAAEIELATKGEDTDGVILEHLGDAYARLGEAEAAAEAYEEAAAAYKKDKRQDRIAQIEQKLDR